LKDDAVFTHLDAEGIPFAVIGAHALAAHGLARFTSDFDVLVMSGRVLARDFWPASLQTRLVSLRKGDDGDPLRGVVRFGPPITVDVVVGRGDIMRGALAHAALDGVIGLSVVTVIDLVSLKLEAGGPQDLADISALLDSQRLLNGHDGLRDDVISRLPNLSAWARTAWQRLGSLRTTR